MDGSAQVPITIPRESAGDIRRMLTDWAGVTGGRIIGETDDQLEIKFDLLITGISAPMMRAELEKRLRPFASKVGVLDKWLLDSQTKAKDWF